MRGHYGTYQSIIYGVASEKEGNLKKLRKQLFPNPMPKVGPKLKMRCWWSSWQLYYIWLLCNPDPCKTYPKNHHQTVKLTKHETFMNCGTFDSCCGGGIRSLLIYLRCRGRLHEGRIALSTWLRFFQLFPKLKKSLSVGQPTSYCKCYWII